MEDSNRVVNVKWNKIIVLVVGMLYGKMKFGFIIRMEKNLLRVIFVVYLWFDKLC